MKILILTILLTFTISPVYSGQYNMPDFTKRNTENNPRGGGYGVDYKYIYASTTGFFVLSSNGLGGGFCTYQTPQRQSAVATTIAILARAPDSITWDKDPDTGYCINVASTGAANDNLSIINPLLEENTHHIDSTSFTTYVSLINLNPIITTNYQFNRTSYTRYQVKYNPLLTYDAGSTLADFDCVIEKQDVMENLLKVLSFKNEKKGVLYAMWGDSRVLVNGIPQCAFGYMSITLRRLVE